MSLPANPGRRHDDEEARRLVAHLDSLHDGDRTVVQIISFGRAAIGPLKSYLFEGKPSGTYQPRQRAIEALAALGANDVLMEYLMWEKQIPDPVARFGEEAVESTAARELAAWRTDDVFELLLAIARGRKLPGVIDALGEFGRTEAIPCLDQALEDDVSRPLAEKAFRKLGVCPS